MRSMTGYGMAETHTPDYHVKVEIRSLNGKYLDINFRMPRYLLSKELIFRNQLGSKIERGTVTVNIHVVKLKVSEDVVGINKALATSYYKQLKSLSQELGAKEDDIFRITTMMQDVIYVDDDEVDDELIELVKQTASSAFEKFDAYRTQEGKSIHQHISSCCENILNQLPVIEEKEPERIESTKERLHNGLVALLNDDNYDKNRFEQELIYYIEKFDISEEKSRLRAHCAHFMEALSNKPKGKKLNFISQEMGREINTLGSKANHSDIQRSVITMKEELEQIKEQVLNIL